VRRLVRDLDIPVRIEGVLTVREADGLALSSRNQYLSNAERRAAPTLAAVLRRIAAALADAPATIALEIARGREALRQAGFEIDYLEVCEAATLGPVVAEITTPARVFAAARLGRTRLIDNMPIAPAA
jgi:pantoate--beta-alanine ligase